MATEINAIGMRQVNVTFLGEYKDVIKIEGHAGTEFDQNLSYLPPYRTGTVFRTVSSIKYLNF